MNFSGMLFFVGYLIVFIAVLFGIIWWDRRRRRTRKPFPEDLRLLRMPGEYLSRRVIDNEANEFLWFLAAVFVPMLAGVVVLQIYAYFIKSALVPGLVLTVMVFVFSMLLCARWIQARLQRQADYYLGFFGERYVAEFLDPLKADGWFVFHDVPCEGATGKFNLDHVAIGPGGIWVVETKTRRKGRARPGLKEHEVVFDGAKVILPWGDDTEGLKQASDNARWLRNWLQTMTGKNFDVAAVLTFPGYCVIERKLGTVRVVNPKGLPQVMVSRGKAMLGRDEIDLVRRQLEQRCRNVEY